MECMKLEINKCIREFFFPVESDFSKKSILSLCTSTKKTKLNFWFLSQIMKIVT